MALTQQEVVDYIKGISVLELSQLVKELEKELGVSAAAAMPMAMPAGGGAARCRSCASRREDRVHRDADRDRHQQDQRDQGGSRSHQPRTEGSEGSRRGSAQADQGRHPEGRGRSDQEEVRGSRREGRDQIGSAARAAASRVAGSGFSRAVAGSEGPRVRIPILVEPRSNPELRVPSPDQRVFNACTASPRTSTESASTFRKSRRPFRSRTSSRSRRSRTNGSCR